MRNIFIKSFVGITCIAGLASCGDSWLETKYHNGVDIDSALDDYKNVGYALNGTYYQLQRYYFAGNYMTTFGDIASDIAYWQGNNNHQNALYQFQYNDTDNTLYYIWDYGYKVVDNSARVVEACGNLYDHVSNEVAEELHVYEAEARCLRAYANLCMVNVFAHQVMVNGTSYGNMPGLVISENPIPAYSEVTRASLTDTYNFIVADLEKAVNSFKQYGDRGMSTYFGLASAYGLLARANMYLENWSAAASAASNALTTAKINTLVYTVDGYYKLYSTGTSNNESLFELAIDQITNWSANSCGTLFTTYGYSLSPYLANMYGDDDCRKPLMTEYYEDKMWSNDNEYVGGKFYYGYGNSALANNFLVNAPEMFLIEAEAYANQNQLAQAQDALLVVAKRNNAITSVADLPQTKDALLAFLHDERARELFQEGFRLFDLRRWDVKANLYAVNAPEVDWLIKNADCANIVFPIPADEINANAGVTQNEGWQNTLPK